MKFQMASSLGIIEQMASSSGIIELDKYFGNNFEMWKLKMEDLLIDRDLWGVVDENLQIPIDHTQSSQYDVIDHKA
jgi:hypothetical protein